MEPYLSTHRSNVKEDSKTPIRKPFPRDLFNRCPSLSALPLNATDLVFSYGGLLGAGG